MICSVCNSEIGVKEIIVCPVCGAQVESDEDEIEKNFHPWILLYTTNSEIEAEMLKANLENAEIPAQILSHSASLALPVGSMGLIKVFVPGSYYEDASALMKTIEESGED